MAEAAKKLQQVRHFVYNRRHAGPRARLRVWFTTVWATLVTGLPEVGLTEETARFDRAATALSATPPWSCHVEVFNPSRGLTVPLGYGASVTGNPVRTRWAKSLKCMTAQRP